MPLISVIIPTLNEGLVLGATLGALARNSVPHEVIVVDGGSTDRTRTLARSAGAHVVVCPWKNRSRQMNAGRKVAQGEILLFLHADTLLASGALETMARSLSAHSAVGGGFARRYDSPSWFLRMTCLGAKWRSQFFGWFLGDQAIFVTTRVFDTLGGYQNLTLFEDLDFSRRMKSQGRLVTVSPPVLSSSRRFSRRGPLPTTLADLALTIRYLLGFQTCSQTTGGGGDHKRPELARSNLSNFCQMPASPGAGQPPRK